METTKLARCCTVRTIVNLQHCGLVGPDSPSVLKITAVGGLFWLRRPEVENRIEGCVFTQQHRGGQIRPVKVKVFSAVESLR